MGQIVFGKHDLHSRTEGVSWNALLQCLALDHLLPRTDEFHWNLDESGKFLVDSMYKALVQPQILVDNVYKI
jgi:hypothetical protein